MPRSLSPGSTSSASRLAHEVRVALQIAQHGDDDRQGYQPLLPVDYVVTVIALAHQN